MPSNSRSNPGLSSGAPRYPGTFLLAFREALDHIKWHAKRWLGDSVECLDENGEQHVVGLENLFRRARREDRESWPALIADFLERIHAAEIAASVQPELSAVADQIMVRLGQSLTLGMEQAKVWSQPLEGTPLFLNLVIDQPDTMSYVTEEMVARSELPGEDWVVKAKDNLKKRTPAGCLEVVHEESGLRLCTVGDAYDASRALILETLMPEMPEAGCLVAIPSRDELLVLPASATALPHVHLLKLLAEKNHRTAPYAVSSLVFWVHNGVWQMFPMHIKPDEVIVSPPEEFLAKFQKPPEAEPPPESQQG